MSRPAASEVFVDDDDNSDINVTDCDEEDGRGVCLDNGSLRDTIGRQRIGQDIASLRQPFDSPSHINTAAARMLQFQPTATTAGLFSDSPAGFLAHCIDSSMLSGRVNSAFFSVGPTARYSDSIGERSMGITITARTEASKTPELGLSVNSIIKAEEEEPRETRSVPGLLSQDSSSQDSQQAFSDAPSSARNLECETDSLLHCRSAGSRKYAAFQYRTSSGATSPLPERHSPECLHRVTADFSENVSNPTSPAENFARGSDSPGVGFCMLGPGGSGVPSPSMSLGDGEQGLGSATPSSFRSPRDSPVEQTSPHQGGSSGEAGLRRYRTAFSKEQISRLEKEFAKENYISRPKRCELAAAMNLPESTIKVWFQNRRMKDKRQRMSLTWPYGIPVDPNLYAYIAAATAAMPFRPTGHTSAPAGAFPFPPHLPPSPSLPGVGQATPPSAFSLPALQARTHLLASSRAELMMSPDGVKGSGERATSHSELLLKSEMMAQSLGIAGSAAILRDPRSSLSATAAAVPPLPPSSSSSSQSSSSSPPSSVVSVSGYPFGLGLTSWGSGLSLPGAAVGSKVCFCPLLPGVHSLAAHWAVVPPLASWTGLGPKPEVTL